MTKDYMPVFVIVPVKRLDNAKSRLASLLTEDERKQFCLEMLEDVLRTVKSIKRPHQTVVVSKDPTVSRVARNFEVTYLKERKNGLNETVSETVDWCVKSGAASVLVIPADIPLVTSTCFKRILTFGDRVSMVISPSRSGKGTNALLLTPPNVSPTFYGPRSFQRHIKEARKLKITVCRYRSPQIALDIDTVEDLTYFVSLEAKETAAYKMLEKTGVTNKLQICQRCRKDQNCLGDFIV